MKTYQWTITLWVRGVKKRCRKPDTHHFKLATSHDDLTDASKPTIGGHDIQTLAKRALDNNMREWSRAYVEALPQVIETLEGGVIVTSTKFPDPRAFKVEVAR